MSKNLKDLLEAEVYHCERCNETLVGSVRIRMHIDNHLKEYEELGIPLPESVKETNSYLDDLLS